MYERTIIIADRDHAYRDKVAGFFRKAGYRVEATSSADHVLHCLQEKGASVLLLGSDFGSQAATAELVRLLKACNRQLHIILVSDEMTLAQARQVREEGIFYHALKPATADEAVELEQVVACAFRKQLVDCRIYPALAALDQAVLSENSRSQLLHALPWMVGLIALILGTNYLSLSAANAAQETNNLSVWLFLAFCAFIVVCQLLPIFRIKMAPGRVDQHHATHESLPRGGK